jgi:hypothetical protein
MIVSPLNSSASSLPATPPTVNMMILEFGIRRSVVPFGTCGHLATARRQGRMVSNLNAILRLENRIAMRGTGVYNHDTIILSVLESRNDCRRMREVLKFG